jgi:hypothetical protein
MDLQSNANPSCDKREPNCRIPRRIVQIYSAPPGKPKDLPLYSQASAVNLRLLNPDYEYRLFLKEDIEAFMASEFPQFQQVLASFPHPIQRFDFFRYLAIFRLGGFYFDLDIFLVRNLDPLLRCSCVFSFEELTISDFLRNQHNMDWEIANYGFAAEPGSPFIAAIIENCVRAQRDPNWAEQAMDGIPRWFRSPFIVPYTTGPGMVSRTLAESPKLSSHVTVLFPPDVCDQSYWQRFGDFGTHAMQGSWRRRDGFIRAKLRRLWEVKKRAAQLKTSRQLGPKRIGQWRILGEPIECSTS